MKVVARLPGWATQGFADAVEHKMQLTAPANRSAAADLGVLRT